MRGFLIVEGGSRADKATAIELRKSFNKLLQMIPNVANRVPVVAGFGRDECINQARDLIEQHPSAAILILIDSDGPPLDDKWAHMKRKHGWEQPPSMTEDHLFFMVQCMECWLLADFASVSRFLKGGPNPAPRKRKTPPEELTCVEAVAELDGLAKSVGVRGYGKVSHGLPAIGVLDPKVLAENSPSARIFLGSMQRMFSAST